MAVVGSHWWGPDVEHSLDRAPETKAKWVAMLERTKGAYRASVSYLLADMPYHDLRGFDPEKLLDNVRLAEMARKQVPWAKALPRDVYLDSVLPYASVTEPRDSMREEFLHQYLPVAMTCRTPGEAALALNRRLFVDYKVVYNTRRLRTDQSPRESIAQGMATCTGLSIMLVDACRAVGVPARLAGIHSWPGTGGNHTWVEVWDNGWHFVGAAEPDEKGLDHAWFVDNASKAIRDVPENAIFAVCYRDTGTRFPLAWDPGAFANAENVTDRYTHGAKNVLPRLMIEVLRRGERVEAEVWLEDPETGDRWNLGKSFGPTSDMNNHLSRTVQPGRTYRIVAKDGEKQSAREVKIDSDTVVRIDLEAP